MWLQWFLYASNILFRFSETPEVSLIQFLLRSARVEHLSTRFSHHVIRNVPEKDVAIITSSNKSILSMIKVLLNLFLSGKLVQ